MTHCSIDQHVKPVTSRPHVNAANSISILFRGIRTQPASRTRLATSVQSPMPRRVLCCCCWQPILPQLLKPLARYERRCCITSPILVICSVRFSREPRGLQPRGSAQRNSATWKQKNVQILQLLCREVDMKVSYTLSFPWISTDLVSLWRFSRHPSRNVGLKLNFVKSVRIFLFQPRAAVAVR